MGLDDLTEVVSSTGRKRRRQLAPAEVQAMTKVGLQNSLAEQQRLYLEEIREVLQTAEERLHEENEGDTHGNKKKSKKEDALDDLPALLEFSFPKRSSEASTEVRVKDSLALLSFWKSHCDTPCEVRNGRVRETPTTEEEEAQEALLAKCTTLAPSIPHVLPSVLCHTIPSYTAMTAAPSRRRRPPPVRQLKPLPLTPEEVGLTLWMDAAPVPSLAYQCQPAVISQLGEGHPMQAGRQSHHLCGVCMKRAKYRCVRCRQALFCSIECHVAHEATRCLKYTV
ncbi:HIT zinc finger containing protein, putative [Angomonas deanei]|uniref:HIT zinc finger containing protein, putative n=1 Tax=Angomonas deanei TaxID=59799 RepID=A0A7G2CU14_9TRYP|nr:HIT zinc finger containing protein, putative [Angomonas deanei]